MIVTGLVQMRKELIYDPLLLLERIGQWAANKKRMGRLKGTSGARLQPGHVDSLELIDLAMQHKHVSVMYDVGAYIGTWALLAKAVIPNARIEAFEPLEKHQRQFVANTGNLAGITLHEVALGAIDTEGYLRETSHSDASSLLPLSSEGKDAWNMTEVASAAVPVTTLDRYIEAHGLPWPDLLKIDVQGYEAEVIRGGIKAMSEAHSVILELSYRELYEGQTLAHSIQKQLYALGFQLHALASTTSTGTPLLQADVLFIR